MSFSDNTPERGAGPFTFESPELAPGEAWTLDLRNRERNGTKNGFRRYLPFDTAQVSNVSPDTYVDVTYNGQYPARVLSNAVESYSQQGVTEVRVVNPDDTATIAAGDVVVELVKEPYDADDAAREQRKRGPVSNVVEHFTGVDPGSVFGGPR